MHQNQSHTIDYHSSLERPNERRTLDQLITNYQIQRKNGSGGTLPKHFETSTGGGLMT